MKKFGNILWGLVFILIGGIIACNAIGITNIDIFFDGWWTMFIIVPCFMGIFKDHDKTGNIIGLLIGLALLLACQGILDFGMVWKLILPAILITIGLSFIFKDVFNNKVNSEIKKLNKTSANQDEYCATFAGQDVSFDGEEFKGVTLSAVFGGVKCDLRNSVINDDVVINTSSVFGGIELFVPDNVKIKIKATPIFGGVSDDKKKYNTNQDSHTIYINATCVFGGVDIK